MHREADAARHPSRLQPFDPGPHRGRDHQPEEEQRDQDAQLPEREHERDDPDDDQRRNGCLSGNLSHG